MVVEVRMSSSAKRIVPSLGVAQLRDLGSINSWKKNYAHSPEFKISYKSHADYQQAQKW